MAQTAVMHDNETITVALDTVYSSMHLTDRSGGEAFERLALVGNIALIVNKHDENAAEWKFTYSLVTLTPDFITTERVLQADIHTAYRDARHVTYNDAYNDACSIGYTFARGYEAAHDASLTNFAFDPEFAPADSH